MKLMQVGPWRPVVTPSWPSLDENNSVLLLLQRRLNEFIRNLGAEKEELSPFAYDLNTFPAVDIQEKEDGYRLEAELPGMTESDIELDLYNNVLSIKGEKATDFKKGDGYIHAERCYGAFSRSIPFSEEIDSDSVEAEFNNGLLTIELKKRTAGLSERKRIPIH